MAAKPASRARPGTSPPHRSRDGSVHVTDERFNTLSHLVGACLAALGTALLVVQASAGGDPWKIVSFAVYGASLIALQAMD